MYDELKEKIFGTMSDRIAKIAKQELGIDTLETRNSDRLDFHDCAVWSIKEALEIAFKHGVEVGAGVVIQTIKPLIGPR